MDQNKEFIDKEPEQVIEPKSKKSKNKGLKNRSNPSKYVDTSPNLKEAPKSDLAVLSFGRMNPITAGHEKLVNTLISVALKKGGIPLVYLSRTSDPKKNPLSYEQKLAFAKKAFGNSIVVKSPARSIIEAAKELQNEYKNLIVVVGSDRLREFELLLKKYNGKEYNFDSIDVISAGERDPDADDVTGISASKMRALAKSGDKESFKKGLPLKLKSQANAVYNAVRSGMGVNESVEDLDEALTRQQRLKRKMIMRRVKSKIMMGRRRALKRKASIKVLQRRARRLAIRMLKKRFSKSNNYADLPYSARARIDDRVARIPKKRLEILARRFLPKVKKAEKDRFAKKIITKKPINPTVQTSVIKIKSNPIKREQVNYFFETFISVKSGNQNSDTSKKILQAVKLAESLGANTNYAIKEIEKIKKGLSRNKIVKEALKRSNDNFSEESYQQYTIERRMNPQDADVKSMPGSQPAGYYKGVPKDKKDDRARHFAKYAKKSDDDPASYKKAPGDEGVKTKPSIHTKNFKQVYGESNYERAMLKRPHMLLDKNGCVVFDQRFKLYRKPKEINTLNDQNIKEEKLQELNVLMEAIEFVFESNPEKAIKDKAEKTGISYSILKKVFDRGVAAWRTGHRPGTTPAQWGLARINSFATGGKTRTTADKDLWSQHKGNKGA